MSTPASATYEARLMGNLGQLSAAALHDSAWIGPLEQLVGAAFSLIESEKRGFSRREYCPRYHPLVQSKIVGLLGDFEAGRGAHGRMLSTIGSAATTSTPVYSD